MESAAKLSLSVDFLIVRKVSVKAAILDILSTKEFVLFSIWVHLIVLDARLGMKESVSNALIDGILLQKMFVRLSLISAEPMRQTEIAMLVIKVII